MYVSGPDPPGATPEDERAKSTRPEVGFGPPQEAVAPGQVPPSSARLNARRPLVDPFGRRNDVPPALGVMHVGPNASHEASWTRPVAAELCTGVKFVPPPDPAGSGTKPAIAFMTSWVVSEPVPTKAENCFGSASAGAPT